MKSKFLLFLALLGMLLSGCNAVLDKPAKYLLERTAPKPSFEPYQPTGNEEAMLARAKALHAAGRQHEVDMIYHELAQAGYPEALWTIAHWGGNGIAEQHCDKANRKAHWVVEKLADQGDPHAIQFYWLCVNQMSFRAHDTGKGLYYLEHLAGQGDLLALNKLYEYRMSWYRNNMSTDPRQWSVRRRHEMHRTPEMEEAGRWLTQYAQVISGMDKSEVSYEEVGAMNAQFRSMANSYMKLGEYKNALKWYQASKETLEDFKAHEDLLTGEVAGEVQRSLWFVNDQIEVAQQLTDTSV